MTGVEKCELKKHESLSPPQKVKSKCKVLIKY